jgi:CRP-like cAMP-binding protein
MRVAETDVQVQNVNVDDFVAQVQALPEDPQNLLMDMARSQRQQTEMGVSRLAKDADARCAEWLLRHAQPDDLLGGLAVKLTERKRTIAAQLGIAPETFSRVLRHLARAPADQRRWPRAGPAQPAGVARVGRGLSFRCFRLF